MTKRRCLLPNEFWQRHLDPPADERELARLYALGPDDHLLISARRGDANRVGSALLLFYLHHPSRVLREGEAPPPALLAYVARQQGVPASAFGRYAARDAIRREHLAELMHAGGYSVLSRALAHELTGFLAASAQTIVRPGQLAGILVDELRRRRMLLPSPLVMEAAMRHSRQRAEALAHGVLLDGLGDGELARLGALLSAKGMGKLT